MLAGVDQVALASEDGQVFTVLTNVAKMSKTLTDLMASVDLTSGNPVQVPTVDAKSLAVVVEWCTRHINDPAPVPKDAKDGAGLGEVAPEPPKLPEEDQKVFAALDQEALFRLILAANYLDIRPLLDQACQAVALSVLGKTPKEIYALFNVTEELTPEEEEEVRKENPWLEDK